MRSQWLCLSILIVIKDASPSRLSLRHGARAVSTSKKFAFDPKPANRLCNFRDAPGQVKNTANEVLVALLSKDNGPKWDRSKFNKMVPHDEIDEREEQNVVRQHKFNYVLETRTLKDKPNSSQNAWIIELNDVEISHQAQSSDGTFLVSEQWENNIVNREFTVAVSTKFIRIYFAAEGGSTCAWKLLDHTQWIILDSRSEFLLFSSERSIRSIKTAEGTRLELNQL